MYLRTVMPAFRVVGTALMVEDSTDNCIVLNLHNFVYADEDPLVMFSQRALV